MCWPLKGDVTCLSKIAGTQMSHSLLGSTLLSIVFLTGHTQWATNCVGRVHPRLSTAMCSIRCCTTRLLTHVPSLAITTLTGGLGTPCDLADFSWCKSMLCMVCRHDPSAELYSHPPPGLWPILSVPSQVGPRSHADYVHALLSLLVCSCVHAPLDHIVVHRSSSPARCSAWLLAVHMARCAGRHN